MYRDAYRISLSYGDAHPYSSHIHTRQTHVFIVAIKLCRRSLYYIIGFVEQKYTMFSAHTLTWSVSEAL